MTSPNSPSSTRKLRLFDIVLFNVSAVLGLDIIGAGAVMGVGGMTWRFIGILFFFIPYGFVSAELGSTWPQPGGIYVWTKMAFGDFWATIASWMYWMNTIYWIPSMYVTFAGTFTSVFFPGMPASGQSLVQAALGTLLIWCTVYLGIKNITLSDFVTNIGALMKAVLFFMLGALGVLYGLRNKLANSFAWPNWKITWDSTMAFAPVIVYSFIGIELVNSFSDKLKSPKKDIPRAVILSGLLVSFLYLFSAFGVLAVFRAEDVNIVTGISDSFNLLIAKTLGAGFKWLFFFMIISLFLALFAFVFAWAFGSNSIIVETGLAKKVKLLGHRHPKYDSPDYAFYVMGIIGTVLLIGNYIGMKNIQQIFWTLFALASILLLAPYLLMFPAVIKLRRDAPDVPRPYRIPGGKIGLWISVILGEFFILLACVFFFVPPKNTTNVLRYELSLIIGIVSTVAIGILIYVRNKKTKN